MAKLLDVFEVGEEFGTQTDIGSWAPGIIRHWTVTADGSVVEIKREV